MAESDISVPPSERRKRFVSSLYRLGRDLDSKERYKVADARRTLARLRRGLVDERYTTYGYEFILPHKLPERQERHGLLVAGLFALNPYAAREGEWRRRLCDALADVGAPGTSEARVRQLIAATQSGGLDYRLRQAVGLVGGARSRIALDFTALLDDLVALDGDESQARRVRLRWARDFQRRMLTK